MLITMGRNVSPWRCCRLIKIFDDGVYMRRKIVFIALLCLFSLTACSNDLKLFTEEVESFSTCLEEYVSTDDLLTQDLRLKVASGDLRKMSQYYERAKSKDAYNEVLDDYISKKMFEIVYEYNSENTKYNIEPAIIEYFAKIP